MNNVPGEEVARSGAAASAAPAEVPEGLLTICAECKRVISFVARPAASRPGLVSHGICPECARRLYGRFLMPRSERQD